MAAISPLDGPVAVTGCSGFTGGHMVRELVLHGYTVRACIRDADSWRGKDCVNYLGRLPNVEIISGCDLFTTGSYNKAFKDCIGVFHVAAVLGNSADGKSQPLGSGRVSQDVYNGGIVGTENVINAINASGSVKRLVYTSSMAAVSGARSAELCPKATNGRKRTGHPMAWTPNNGNNPEMPIPEARWTPNISLIMRLITATEGGMQSP